MQRDMPLDPGPGAVADLLAELSGAKPGDAAATCRALLDAAALPLYTTDTAGRLTYYNSAAAEFWGWQPPLREPAEGGAWRIRLSGAEGWLAHARPIRMQWAEMSGPGGSPQRFAIFPGPIRDAGGRVVGAVNLLLDPAGLPAPEPQAADRAAEPAFLLFVALRDGTGRVEDFVLRRANGVMAWLPGLVEAGAPGRTLSGLLPGNATEAARLIAEYAAALSEGLPRPGTWPGQGFPGGRCRLVPAGECIALLLDPEHAPSDGGSAFATGQDEVTGLRDRDSFMRMLEDSLDAAGEHIATVLLLISLQGVQQARAGLGAAAADMLLRHAASRLARVVRSGDVMARSGEATFAVLMAPGADAAAGAALAGRIGRTLGRPFGLDGVTVLLDTAVGIALAPRDGATAETLLQGAELAARRARGAGRSAAQAEG